MQSAGARSARGCAARPTRRSGPRLRGSAAARVRPDRGGGHAGTCDAGSKHRRRTLKRRGMHAPLSAPNGAGCLARRGGATATRKRTCVLPYVVSRTDGGVCKTSCERGHICSVGWRDRSVVGAPAGALAEWDCSGSRCACGWRCASPPESPLCAGFSRDLPVDVGRGDARAGEGSAP